MQIQELVILESDNSPDEVAKLNLIWSLVFNS